MFCVVPSMVRPTATSTVRACWASLSRRFADDRSKLMADGRAAAQAAFESPGRQRLVVALGGNALLRRGEPLTLASQMAAAATAAPMLVELSKKHEVILVHGNGPQVGIL
jgi:hypothetical protein